MGLQELHTEIDPETRNAVSAFVEKLVGRFEMVDVILFGSRSRQGHRPDSDADIVVLLRGVHGNRMDVAIDMAGIAFDVLLETGILVEALPLWEDEWEHPERFNNPFLIENIRREGVRL